jgi:hypothetical protein
MSELKTDSIANRLKQRVKIKARIGRVGGTEHNKKIILRKKAMELKKRRKNRKIEC